MKKYLNDHFKMLEKHLEFPADAIADIEKIVNKIDSCEKLNEKFTKIVEDFFTPKAHSIGEYLKKIDGLAFGYRFKRYTFHLVFLMVCAERLHELYKENNISEEIYFESVNDIKYKFKECVDCKGVNGVFVAWWATEFFSLERFGLGRYQYDMSTYGEEDFTTSAGITIKKGDKTLGFHIPSSGVPLTDEVRLDSFKKAYEFFTDFRRDDGLMIFECGSWLIYPPYKDFLPENSNILKFIGDFEIVEAHESEKFGDAWRVFGKYGYKSPKHWPEDTSMRRAFKKHILAGGKTGHGHGIIVFDGEKIVR